MRQPDFDVFRKTLNQVFLIRICNAVIYYLGVKTIELDIEQLKPLGLLNNPINIFQK